MQGWVSQAGRQAVEAVFRRAYTDVNPNEHSSFLQLPCCYCLQTCLAAAVCLSVCVSVFMSACISQAPRDYEDSDGSSLVIRIGCVNWMKYLHDCGGVLD